MANNGEDLFQSAWLQCKLSASFKPDEAFVRIEGAFTPEIPTFYVSRSLVDPQPTEAEVDGQVRVTWLHRGDVRSLVEISGEPVTFGPRVEVPTAALT